MVDQRLQGMISLLLRYDLLTNTRLFLQHEPYSAMSVSVSRGRRFLFGSNSPYVIQCLPL